MQFSKKLLYGNITYFSGIISKFLNYTFGQFTFHVTFNDWSPVGWTDSSLGGPDGARKSKTKVL